jgi:hypothetical protein
MNEIDPNKIIELVSLSISMHAFERHRQQFTHPEYALKTQSKYDKKVKSPPIKIENELDMALYIQKTLKSSNTLYTVFATHAKKPKKSHISFYNEKDNVAVIFNTVQLQNGDNLAGTTFRLRRNGRTDFKNGLEHIIRKNKTSLSDLKKIKINGAFKNKASNLGYIPYMRPFLRDILDGVQSYTP